MWQLVISALSPFVAACLTWWAFTRQIRRNSVVQVYLDVVPTHDTLPRKSPFSPQGFPQILPQKTFP